ncbi:MAG: flagellar biosynthetic protein FliO [Ghiorsea sp.]
MEESNFVAMMVQSIVALAVVLAIFAALVWGLRRFQQTTLAHQGESMAVIQRLHLDARNSVVEIRHGDQHYLLGVGQSGIQKIADITPAALDAVPTRESHEA